MTSRGECVPDGATELTSDEDAAQAKSGGLGPVPSVLDLVRKIGPAPVAPGEVSKSSPLTIYGLGHQVVRVTEIVNVVNLGLGWFRGIAISDRLQLSLGMRRSN